VTELPGDEFDHPPPDRGGASRGRGTAYGHLLMAGRGVAREEGWLATSTHNRALCPQPRWSGLPARSSRARAGLTEVSGFAFGYAVMGLRALRFAPTSRPRSLPMVENEAWCRRWESNPHDLAIGGF